MSPDKEPSTTSKVCPTCGTRLSVDAVRCLVCGTELAAERKSSGGKPAKKPAVRGSRMPQISLSLPVALGIVALILAAGAALVYFLVGQATETALQATPTPTITFTPTASLTPTPFTPTPTDTPQPTPTPFSYTVKLGDSCSTIAFAFKVSIQSLVLLNNLPADCSTLYENQRLLIPQPTPTVTPPATSTLSPAEATEAACEKYEYIVQENDTLSSIAFNFQVPTDAIREYNGLVADIVRYGQKLQIPLCRRNAPPGETPTPTMPPPYPAASLLLPADGAPFNLANNIITLQWASVGALRSNEAYAVSLEDITEGKGRKLVDYVTDTKYIVPASFLPNDGLPHVIRWFVVPVRQTGTDDSGNPIWEPGGAPSAVRVFTWQGAVPAATPTPQ